LAERNGSGDTSIEGPAEARPGTVTKASGAGKRGKTRKTGSNDDVGRMLRGVYHQTVDEPIPDDLMDLLNKLE
jgi:hypothetical protein